MSRSLGVRFNSAAISEINMVPMIDVMLVLVVILLVTAPVLTRSIPLVLPKTSAGKSVHQQAPIDISINEQGQLFWNGKEMDRNQMQAKMQETVSMNTQTQGELPSVQIRADHRAPYRYVAFLLADAAAAGFTKIGFVSQPDNQ